MREVIEQIREHRRRIDFRRGQEQAVRSRAEANERNLEAARRLQNLKREAVVLVESAGRTAQESVTGRIAEIVTFALQSVFGDEYKFHIFTLLKRNAVWADFCVASPGVETDDPMDSRGGGVVDLVSLALRAVFLELFLPRIDGPLILDEPTKHLSKEFAGRAAELLRALTERTGRQIILVTHDPELAKEAQTRRTI